jgi:hypothetical protein
MWQDHPMTQTHVDLSQEPADYRVPKLDGARVALRSRVTPEQHKHAHLLAQAYGMSISELVGALIDREAGLRTPLDDLEDEMSTQEELPIRRGA